MTTLTIKVSDKKKAQMIYEMLSDMKFVKQVEMNDEYDLNEHHPYVNHSFYSSSSSSKICFDPSSVSSLF